MRPTPSVVLAGLARLMGKPEATVEQYLHQCVVSRGGTTRKYTSPSHSGVADRLVLIPFGLLWIVEVKTDVGRESGVQQRERERMLKLGYRALVVYGKKDVDALMVQVDQMLAHWRVVNGVLVDGHIDGKPVWTQPPKFL